MLKVDINGEEGKFIVQWSGCLSSLCTEITMLLSGVYEGLSDDETKDMFIECMEDMVKHKLFVKSGEEIQELTEELQKETKKLKKERDKSIDDLIAMLKDVLKWNYQQV